MPSPDLHARRARVVAVRGNLVTVHSDDVLIRNEVAFIRVGDARLQGELLRVRDRHADLQVFDDTRGVRVGDEVELSGELLSATLGPGLLGSVYDGLQNPLHALAGTHGFFLPRGTRMDALDAQRRWNFTRCRDSGQLVSAGDLIGHVDEGSIRHAVFAPLHEPGPLHLTWLCAAPAGIDEPVARFQREDGSSGVITLRARWPIRIPFGTGGGGRANWTRLPPDRPLFTSMRVIDTFFPIAQGGTACIPGPFGAGKTVLQSLIARYAEVDVVIMVACGERAGEVVETITEFPTIEDPRTGGSLLDRTIIVCNTSSMPIAARESSIYLGLTLGEYYRHMGLRVLTIADSTSRWAQALREISGRMEEIPGEEAYPAYLGSSIKAVYERAGVIRRSDGAVGSLTLIGTVSPAGGNFDEPVTQATLGTVKAFLGLSAERAYRRHYPAIDPLLSWSRYSAQLAPALEHTFGADWPARVARVIDLLRRGERIEQLLQVTGEEGVVIDDYVAWQKARLVDAVYLQQDAFDEVDRASSVTRQRESFELLERMLAHDPACADTEAARAWFVRLTSLFRNLHYSPQGSAAYDNYRQLLLEAIGEPAEEAAE